MNLLLEISQNQMSLYTSLIGVAGTLLGTILGYILSNLSRLGKQTLNIRNIELNYYHGIVNGCAKYNNSYLDNGKIAGNCHINADFYITNSSNEPYNFNSLILIIKNKEEKFESKVSDKNDNYKHLESITIQGKSGEYFKLHSNFDKPIEINDNFKFYLQYIDVKGKVRIKKIEK